MNKGSVDDGVVEGSGCKEDEEEEDEARGCKGRRQGA